MCRTGAALLTALLMPAILGAALAGSLRWTELPALPDTLGVAGPLVGTHV